MVDSSKRLMKKLLSFASNNRNLMILLLLKGQGGDEKLRNAISETLVAIEKEFANNIQRAIELQMLEDRDCVEFQAQMLTSLVTGTISRWLFGPMHELNYQPSLSIDRVVDEMVRYEFFGLIGQGGRQ